MERRFFQRVPLQVSAIVTTEDGVRIKVVTSDISTDGLGIECNAKQRNMITPGGSFVRSGKPISVSIDLNLNETIEFPSKLVARCQIAFSRRMSNNHCKLGLRYIEIDNNGYELLVQYVENAITSD